MKPDRIAFAMILAEIRASIRSARRRDLVWAFGGGGLLAAYAIGIVVLRLNHNAEAAREAVFAWWIALPAALALFGAASGFATARLALSRAHAPFLKAQPLSNAARRRMAAYAALRLGLPFIILDGILVAVFAGAAGQPAPLAWGLGAVAVSAAGHFVGMQFRLRRPWQPSLDRRIAAETPRGVSLGWIDRRKPAWIGSWAGGFVAGRYWQTFRGAVLWLFFAVAGVGLATGSIVNASATPAVLGGVVGGLAIFMLALRCRPLLSPILRASRLSFTRAVRGLVRLPLVLSLLFFGALAVPATAAEPGMLATPLSGALGLLSLNAIYTVFAAFFAHSRRLAAMAFFAALGLAAYESLEYSGAVLIGLAALLVFLWLRARKAYRHG